MVPLKVPFCEVHSKSLLTKISFCEVWTSILVDSSSLQEDNNTPIIIPSRINNRNSIIRFFFILPNNFELANTIEGKSIYCTFENQQMNYILITSSSKNDYIKATSNDILQSFAVQHLYIIWV